MQTHSRWSGPPVREVVWEAVQDFTGGDVNIEFAVKDIKAIILKKYPDFNVNTIGSQIMAQCANSASRRHHGPGIDRYWKVKYGVYRLYEPDQLHESDQPYESNQPVDLDNVLEKINEIAKESATGDYIYRGESSHHKKKPYYGKVSSGLYRDYISFGVEKFDMAVVQADILREAHEYTPHEMKDFELLATLQHYGDQTNLIDFTTDYLVALFFACDGKPQEPGRVILIQRPPKFGHKTYKVEKPPRTIRRAEAQKSIFVRAERGFVEPDKVVCIPADLKLALLDYLNKHHDISTKTIYNDLHGFIDKRKLHKRAYAAFHEGFTSQGRANSAETEAEKQKWYNEAITHYTKAIDLNPEDARFYNNRSVAYRGIGDFNAAIEDFNKAIDLDAEVAIAYNGRGLASYDFDAAIEDFNKAIDLAPKDAGVKGEYMRNRRFNRNIFGDLRTQEMAQEVLPILVSHAQKGDIIIMRDLAKEIAPELVQFNWSMGWALAWIHTTLWELERSDEWNYGEMPAIAAIVLADHETPTNWMDEQTRIDPNTPLPWEDYETNHILPVFEYPHWDKVMDFVFGS